MSFTTEEWHRNRELEKAEDWKSRAEKAESERDALQRRLDTGSSKDHWTLDYINELKAVISDLKCEIAEARKTPAK